MLCYVAELQTRLFMRIRLTADRGATATEYALMVGLIFLVIGVAVTALGLSVKALFESVKSAAPFK